MPRRTFIIINIDGRYYRSFCDSYFTTANSQIFVTDTADFEKARTFRSLRWATHRAKFLSVKSNRYHYVYEAVGNEGERKLIIRNEQIIKRIRKTDTDTINEIENMIANWKMKHGLD